MEYLVKNPVIGALLNCISYGLADLYVGHFATGIFKLLLNAIAYFSVVMLIQYLAQYYPYECLSTLVLCVYIPFALITGYRTVVKSRGEQVPSN